MKKTIQKKIRKSKVSSSDKNHAEQIKNMQNYVDMRIKEADENKKLAQSQIDNLKALIEDIKKENDTILTDKNKRIKELEEQLQEHKGDIFLLKSSEERLQNQLSHKEDDQEVLDYQPRPTEVYCEALSDGRARIAVGEDIQGLLDKYKTWATGKSHYHSLFYIGTFKRFNGSFNSGLFVFSDEPGVLKDARFLLDKVLITNGSSIVKPFDKGVVDVIGMQNWLQANLSFVIGFIRNKIMF